MQSRCECDISFKWISFVFALPLFVFILFYFFCFLGEFIQATLSSFFCKMKIAQSAVKKRTEKLNQSSPPAKNLYMCCVAHSKRTQIVCDKTDIYTYMVSLSPALSLKPYSLHNMPHIHSRCVYSHTTRGEGDDMKSEKETHFLGTTCDNRRRNNNT